MIHKLTNIRNTPKHQPPPQNANDNPQHDNEDNEKGEQHRNSGTNENEPHIESHQTTDKNHKQNNHDDNPRNKNNKITNFHDNIQRDLTNRFLFRAEQTDMSHDILHHNDRIIHQNTDRKYQREEHNTVENITVEIDYEQDQRENGKNHEKNNQ
jgi:hypothetical protein